MARAGVITASLKTSWFDCWDSRCSCSWNLQFDLLAGMWRVRWYRIMGEKYALLAGEDAAVATAIREHYGFLLIRQMVPFQRLRLVLSLRLQINWIPSFLLLSWLDSIRFNDPYALRRAAQGIVRILDGTDLAYPDMDESWLTTFWTFIWQPFLWQSSRVLNFIKARVDKMMGASKISKAVLAGFKLCH